MWYFRKVSLKSMKQWKDQCQPGTKEDEGSNRQDTGLLGQWNYSELHYTAGYRSLGICLSPQVYICNTSRANPRVNRGFGWRCVHVSSVVTNEPGGGVDSGGAWGCAEVRSMREISAPSFQFCCEPKTVITNKLFKIITHIWYVYLEKYWF